MKKLFTFCAMMLFVFAVSAKPAPSAVINNLKVNNNLIENFKKPAAVLTGYLFKYELEPTGTFGQWDVYLALYAKYSDGTIDPAYTPTNITVTMTSPIYLSATFLAVSQNQWVGVINTGSSTEYTGDIAITASPDNINGYPISPIVQHL